MQSKHYSLGVLAVTFLALFNAQSSYAVSITYEKDIGHWPYLHTQLFDALGRQGKPKAASKLENQ